MSWPAVVLWMLILGAAFTEGPALLYLLVVCGIFGSLQMLPGDGSGVTLLPQSVCAAFFVCKVMLWPGNITRAAEAALDPLRVGLFAAFMLFALVTAITLPRAFAGMVEVVPVSGFRFGTSVLAPISGNYTQSGYMLLSFATTLCVAVIGARDDVRRHYLLAVLTAAICLVLSGLADLVLYHAGLSALLDPFRTATYALLTDVEAVGAKRVVGLTPEASTYGSFCVGALGLLTFLRRFYRPGIEHLCVVATIVMLIVMTALSTSSSSYVGLAVFAMIYGIDFLRRFLRPARGQKGALRVEAGILGAITFIAFALVVLVPGVADPLVEMVDKMVFQKSATASYIERSAWNQVGWQAFLDTGGLGTGLGSIRVSNWSLSILGSTGMFGGLLMFGFVLQKLILTPRNATAQDAEFALGLKAAIAPTFVMYQLGGTIPDIGISTSLILGLLSVEYATRRAQGSEPSRARGIAPA